MFAMAAIPVFVSIGAGFDYGRAQILKTRLGEALDKAALAVGAQNTTNERVIQETLDKYFNANFASDGVGLVLSIGKQITEGKITLTAKGVVNTAFLKIIGVPNIEVSVISVVLRETTGLEVALVLDNTGSMARNNRIGNLRIASAELVDILFQDEERPENVKIGLVPFVTTVNIGNGDQKEQDFIRVPSPPNDYPTTDPKWKGCVEARESPADVRDTFNKNSDGKFGKWNPYYWEAEPVLDGSTIGRRGSFFNVCTNMWWLPELRAGLSQPIATGRSGRNFSTYPDRSQPPRFFFVDTIPPDTQGPNKACPDPIIPLTNDKKTLTDAIQKMQPWSGNGTMAHLGAVWGWRVLSSSPPFTEGQPKGTDGVKKAVIILTDGDNLISQQRSSFCTGIDDKYTSHYTGYGYISENRLGTRNFTSANQKLNSKLKTVCKNIRDQGIEIYTITFEVNNAATKRVFIECAGKEENYFNSPDAATLKESFRAIGAQLNALRIAK